MPKIDIDYSNTIIYKIYCKDPSIKDVYVGHTTNFVQRKYAHKQSCVNEKNASYECKLYKIIRENGGWYNWNMTIIDFFNCQNQHEARIKEQEYFILLNATMNSVEPIPKPKENIKTATTSIKCIYKCDICNITVQNEKLMDLHNKTAKHLKMLDFKNKNESTPTNYGNFSCNKCNYSTYRKSQYLRHLSTNKHKNVSEHVKKKFICICGKEYKHDSSYYKHKKKCVQNNSESNNTEINNQQSTNELVLHLLNENMELQKQITELCKEKNKEKEV
jgi:hypothetical protein